jgi:hypothetical protein
LSILSEAYSHLDFKGRVAVTAAFVEEILKYSAAHSSEILSLIKSVDSATSKQFGVSFEMEPLANQVDILVGEVEKIRNPRNGRDMTAMVANKFTPQRMPDYGVFAASRPVPAPRFYILRREPALQAVVENLRTHGITVQELSAPASLDVDAFEVTEVNHASRQFQGHSETTIEGVWRKDRVEFPAGSYVVRVIPPLSSLIFYLLEPESDDGLTTWNFFDSLLEKGKLHPVYKLMKDARLATR